MEQARTSLSSGDPAGAAALLQRILVVDPANVDAHFALFEAFVKLGLSDEADRIFEKLPSGGGLREQATALKSSLSETIEPGGVLKVAEAYRKSRLDRLAVAAYERASAGQSKDPRTLKGYADVLDRTGRRTEAIETYKRAIQKSPNDEELNLRLGAAYFREKQFPAAIDHYRKALEQNPRNAKTYFDLADILHALKEYDTEREVFMRLLDRNLSEKSSRQARLMLRRLPAKTP
jgi:tetratricopeptide (TPR) repeat protein